MYLNSYNCQKCKNGFQLTSNGLRCEKIRIKNCRELSINDKCISCNNNFLPSEDGKFCNGKKNVRRFLRIVIIVLGHLIQIHVWDVLKVIVL